MAPITVAIAGATGLTGQYITRAFLSSAYKSHAIKHVIAFTRNASSPSALALKALGAELQDAGPSLETLKGVDVLVNTLDGQTPAEVQDAYARAAAEAGVKVYMPSEFGGDHYAHQSEGYIFAAKRKHDQLARSLNGGSLKVISILNAMFLEWALGKEFGPSLGIDIAARTVTSVGSPDQRVSLNSLVDIASTVVQMSLRAIEDRNSVPDRVRISGDSKSYNELADIARRVLGGEVIVKSIDIEEFEATAEPNVFKVLRLRFATGQSNFDDKHDNEFVNPGETLWKWRKAEDFVRETYA